MIVVADKQLVAEYGCEYLSLLVLEPAVPGAVGEFKGVPDLRLEGLVGPACRYGGTRDVPLALTTDLSTATTVGSAMLSRMALRP